MNRPSAAVDVTNRRRKMDGSRLISIAAPVASEGATELVFQQKS